MEIDEAREIAGQTAKWAGLASFSGVMVALFLFFGGVPEAYMWGGAGLFGVGIWATLNAMAPTWLAGRYVTDVPDVVDVPDVPVRRLPDMTPEPLPVVAGPLDDILRESGAWPATVDWSGLVEYVRQPEAVLSRQSVAAYVDQRFYSPREGDPSRSFPELMVNLGAARKLEVNNATRYIWTKAAPEMLRRLQMHLFGASPTLPER